MRRKTVNDLFVKMYEDWSAGRITESNFNLLSERYQAEQADLDDKIAALKSAMENAKQSESSEYLCRTILALPAAADDLLLHLIKHIPADDGLMGSLHSNPFRDRIPYLQQKGGRVYHALHQLQHTVRLCAGTAAILGIHGTEG